MPAKRSRRRSTMNGKGLLDILGAVAGPLLRGLAGGSRRRRARK